MHEKSAKKRTDSISGSLLQDRLYYLALSGFLGLIIAVILALFGLGLSWSVLLWAAIFLVGSVTGEFVSRRYAKSRDRPGSSGDLDMLLDIVRREAAESGIVLLVTPNGAIDYSNEGLFERFGYTDDEIAFIGILDLIAPEWRDSVKDTLKSCCLGRPTDSLDVSLIDRNGSAARFSSKWTPALDCRSSENICRVVFTEYSIEKAAPVISFPDVFDLSTDGYALIDGDKVVFANRALGNMLGYSEGALVGKGLDEILCADCYETIDRYLQLVRQGGNPPVIHIARLTAADGDSIRVSVGFEGTESNGRKLVLAHISCLRKGSRKTIEPERRLGPAFRQSRMGILLLDNEGSAIDMNPAFARIWGIPHAEDEFERLNVFGQNRPTGFDKLDFDLAYSGETVDWQSQVIEFPRGENESGHTGTISSMLSPVFSEDGEVGNVVVFSREVTAKEPPGILKKCIQMLFNNTNDAILISTVNGGIIQANRAAETVTGYSVEELVGMSFHDLFDIEGRELSLRQIAWIKSGNRVHYESGINASNGEKVRVDISGRLIEGQADRLLIIVMRDITERKRLLASLSSGEKMESLAILAGGIAHDFNNILEGILGAAEIAMGGCPADSENAYYIELIVDLAKRGGHLTKHLLSYAYQSDMEFEIIDLNLTVSEAIEFLSSALDKKIPVKTHLESELKPIMGDPNQLKQVVISLALNARDSMTEGGEILVRTENITIDERFARDHPGLSPGPHVKLAICDSGKGISPKILSRVFDPFFTTKKREHGTGMGLSIAQSTISSHGGIIDISSRPNEGTEVRIYLPALSADVENYERIAPLEKVVGKGKTIMVVDDEEIIQTVLGGILGQLGYKTIGARRGKEALDILSEGVARVDAILLDMIMPGFSGEETYKLLREYRPEIPVVVITGYGNDARAKAMLEAGLAGYIEKPFRASQIAERLNQIFSE